MKDIQENIPTTDYESWKVYPKFNYVLDTLRLFEIQHIEATPFITMNSRTAVRRYNFDSDVKLERDLLKAGEFNNYIFTDLELAGKPLISHAVVIKGNVEFLKHFGNDNGLLDLKLHSFSNIHLSKYRGLVQFETIDNVIVNVSLAVHEDRLLDAGYSKEWLAALQRVYTNHTWKFTDKTVHEEQDTI